MQHHIREYEVRYQAPGLYGQQFRVLRAADEESIRRFVGRLGAFNVYIQQVLPLTTIESPDVVDLEVHEAVTRAQREILLDVALGRVPRTVASFSELHDYVDANGYGGAFEDSREVKRMQINDWEALGSGRYRVFWTGGWADVELSWLPVKKCRIIQTYSQKTAKDIGDAAFEAIR